MWSVERDSGQNKELTFHLYFGQLKVYKKRFCYPAPKMSCQYLLSVSWMKILKTIYRIYFELCVHPWQELHVYQLGSRAFTCEPLAQHWIESSTTICRTIITGWLYWVFFSGKVVILNPLLFHWIWKKVFTIQIWKIRCRAWIWYRCSSHYMTSSVSLDKYEFFLHIVIVLVISCRGSSPNRTEFEACALSYIETFRTVLSSSLFRTLA